MGDLERARPAQRRAARPTFSATAGEPEHELLRLQTLAGNAAVGGLLSVQRQTLSDDLASIDDDAATMAAVNAGAERGETRDAFEEGQAAFRRHDYRHAADQFEQAAATAAGADRDRMLQNAAEAYEREGREVGVAGSAQPGADRLQAEQLATLVQEGAGAFSGGDFATALRLFEQVYEVVPAAEIAWNMAMTEFRLESYADARDHFVEYQRRGRGEMNAARWIERCDRSMAGNQQLSTRDVAALGESEAESIEAIVGEAGRVDAEAESTARFEEGLRLFRGEDFLAAAREFLASGAAPDDPAAAFNAGRAYQQAGRFEAALEAYHRAFGR